jgi:hypothetical protein
MLARLVQRLREAGGENLLGVAVYGAQTRSRPVSGAAEVNVLIVLRDATLPALVAIAPVLTSAQRQSQVSSLVTTPEELHTEAGLFPARLLEMRLTHRLLHGNVHLDRLEIAPPGLRLAALQELRNLENRLRHRIVNHGTDPDLLWAGLAQSLPRLMAILETVLHAGGGEVPPERAEVLRLAGEALGIEPARMEQLGVLRLTARRPNDEAVRDEVTAYLALLGELERRLGSRVAGDGLPPGVC